jgi:hypothetical protein
MSNNGAKQYTHTHNCVSPPGKVISFFVLSHFFSSFIRHRNNFPSPLSGSRDSQGPVVVVLLGTAQQHLMIEFNGVQGPVYLFLTHGREKKETPKFRFQYQSPPHPLRLLLAPYLLKEQKDEKSLFSFLSFKIKDRYVITNGQQRIAPF